MNLCQLFRLRFNAKLAGLQVLSVLAQGVSSTASLRLSVFTNHDQLVIKMDSDSRGFDSLINLITVAVSETTIIIAFVCLLPIYVT